MRKKNTAYKTEKSKHLTFTEEEKKEKKKEKVKRKGRLGN